MSIVHTLITAENDSLIGVERGDPSEGGEQILGAHGAAVHDQGPVGLHVDDHLSDGAALLLGFAGRRHLHVQFPFLPRKTPGQHEEAE